MPRHRLMSTLSTIGGKLRFFIHESLLRTVFHAVTALKQSTQECLHVVDNLAEGVVVSVCRSKVQEFLQFKTDVVLLLAGTFSSKEPGLFDNQRERLVKMKFGAKLALGSCAILMQAPVCAVKQSVSGMFSGRFRVFTANKVFLIRHTMR